jgi:hypothetical protein
MFKMGKERLLTTMFQSITSEERNTKLILNEQVVQMQLVVNQPKKCHVGKARKVVVAILFPQEIKREDEEGKQQKKRGLSLAKNDEKLSKKRGSYTNWFHLHLWLPIATTIKKHGNNFGTLHFFKTTLKRPDMPSPY